MPVNADPTDPRASDVDRGRLPVIDLAGRHAALVAQLRDACLRHGFFYLVNHGVDRALMREVVAQARRFFAQDAQAKQAVAAVRPSGPGYGRMGGKVLHGGRGAPVKEEFYYSRDHVPGVAEENRWPQELPGFREPLRDYIEAMHALAERMMGLLAETLGLPRDHFAGFCESPMAAVRLARYPAEGAEAGAHSDFGALTFLLQETMGGLQVFDRVTGGWIRVVPIPGSFVVNLGDLFAIFTNGRYPSTPHRVVHPAGEERISVPFFYTGRHDYVVRCLPGLLQDGETPKYAPTTPSGNLVAGHEAQGF